MSDEERKLRFEVRQLTQKVRDVQGEYQVHQIKLEAENAELRAEIARLTKTDISKDSTCSHS